MEPANGWNPFTLGWLDPDHVWVAWKNVEDPALPYSIGILDIVSKKKPIFFEKISWDGSATNWNSLMLQSRQDLIPGQICVRNVICGRIYAKLKPDNLIRNRHIITVDNEGKQTEQDMAQDLKLPFNIQVKVTFAKKTFYCQIILTIVLSTQRIPSVWVDSCSLVCIAR